MQRPLIIVFLLFSFSLIAGVYEVDGNLDYLGESISIYTGRENKLEKVISDQDNWTPQSSEVLNLGVSPNQHFLKLDIRNGLKTDDLAAVISYALIDEVTFYNYKSEEQIDSLTLGDLRLFSDRIIDHRYFFFPFKLKSGGESSLFIKVNTAEQLMIPLKIGSRNELEKKYLKEDLYFGVYLGLVVALFIYNLFLFIAVRDRNYLYYIVYVLFISATQLSLENFLFQYLWPNNPDLANVMLYILPSLAGTFVLVFITGILNGAKYFPKLNKVKYIIFFLYIMSSLCALFGNRGLAYRIIDVTALLGSILVLVIIIYAVVKKLNSSNILLIGWAVLLTGVVVFVLRNFNVLSDSFFTTYSMQLGTSAELVILSFALANRINTLKKDKQDLILKQNTILEERVNKVTKDLKKSQVQLVHAEKMASLGQLTAGVAHEINNPMNFATQRIQILRRDMEDVNALLSKYESLLDETGKKEITEFKKSIDFEIIEQEIEESFDGLKEGVARALEISKSLRDFSRLDQSVYKRANINDGIEATIKMLGSKFSDFKINTLVNLSPDIPEIDCSIGKLNQVFMNILDNAIDATNERRLEEKEIKVTSSINNNMIQISVEDNGIGISKDTLEKIFDPFFTTKDVGKGTGLGMSISLGIVEEHHGTIEIESSNNNGTIVNVFIPISR